MSDTESETEMVARPQKKQFSEAKLQALALARQKAAQKAKQRSAVTKAMKDGARVARIADKANALALEQKRKTIESGLMVDEEPVVATPVAPVVPNDFTSMRAELASLKDMLLKRFEPPTDIPPPRIKTIRRAKPIPEDPPAPRRRAKPEPAVQPVVQPVYPEPARSRTDQLRALLGR